jgi:putative protease
MDELLEGIDLAHQSGKKVYLALNLIAHNRDIERLPEHLSVLQSVKPDGAIVADPAIFEYLREEMPSLNLHVSVQSNVTSWMGVKFWEKMGAKMCILSRELGMRELEEIRTKCPNIRLEAFIHGSMCMSYSGRCLLSNYFTGRGANQGQCSHSCRWNYKVHVKLRDGLEREALIDENSRQLFDFFLEEETRPNEWLNIEEWEGGSHLLNSKDLCLLPLLPKYMQIGLDCLKIEGRNKTQYYAGMVARTYRRAIDAYFDDAERWDYREFLDDLYSISNRGYSLAFAKGKPTCLANNYDATKSLSEWEYAGHIESYEDGYVRIAVKNRMDAGDEVEIISPTHRKTLVLNEFINAKTDETTQVIHAGQDPVIRLATTDMTPEDYPPLTLIRKRNRDLNDDDVQRIEEDKRAFKEECDAAHS